MYQKIFKLHSDILKALAHPKRLEIIHLLRDSSLSVTEIQNMLDLPQANLSQHLSVLRTNNIVISKKKGKQIYYRVFHKNYLKACDLIREVLFQSQQEGNTENDLSQNLSSILPIGIDPVCKMKLTPQTASFTLTHQNENLYFCASGCLQKYKHLNNIS